MDETDGPRKRSACDPVIGVNVGVRLKTPSVSASNNTRHNYIFRGCNQHKPLHTYNGENTVEAKGFKWLISARLVPEISGVRGLSNMRE